MTKTTTTISGLLAAIAATAMANIKAARILPLERESSAALEVAQGKADAFIYDQMSTYRNWQRHSDSTEPRLTPIQSETWAIGLRQDDSELLRQINEFLAEFRADGGFERLGEQFLAKEKAAFAELGVPFFF